MMQVSVPVAGASARAAPSLRRAPTAATDRGAAGLRPGELRVERGGVGRGSSVVLLTGEVDMHTAPQLKDALDDAAGNEGTAVVVDLTECSFIDSTGVHVLVGANEWLRHSSRRLIVVASDRRVLRPFELTGVDAVLDVYCSRPSALAPARESWNDEARRRVSIRVANEQLKQSCVTLGATGEGRFVFICECGDRACTSLLHLSLAEYESVRAHPARFVVARNYENPEAERVVQENGRFAVVETVTGERSKPALESNPRWQRGEPW